MDWVERYGPWALVTGASAGIGSDFAEALARKGLNLVLTARRSDRLEELSKSLKERWNAECLCLPLDLSREDAPAEIARATEGLDVGLLVNNAGFGAMGRFDSHEPNRLAEMIRLNCLAPILLTSAFLPRLKARGRAGVIFLASVAGYQPTPYMACYGATKGFGLLFGEALAAEMDGSGVDVLVVSPGATETEFQQVAGAVPHAGDTSEAVVKEALAALGRKHTVVTGWGHKVQAFSGRLFPRRFVARTVMKVLSRMTPPDKR